MLATAALLLTTMATPASAHYFYQEHGHDYGGVIDHRHVVVDDGECDGNGVYVDLYYSDPGGAKIARVWDSDGCRGYSGSQFFPPVIMFRLCENRVGCLPWAYT